MCAWWCHSLVWYVLIYMYMYIPMHMPLYLTIYMHTYVIAGLSLFVFRFLTHISWIIFFLFHLVYRCVWTNCLFQAEFLIFSWDRVSDSCSAFSIAPVSIREAQHNSIFPWLDSSFWRRLSSLGPANSFSSLCSFSLSLVIASSGCRIVSYLALGFFHHQTTLNYSGFIS